MADGEDYKKFFQLEKGEQIIEAIKPLPALKWSFILTGLLATALILLLIFTPFFSGLIFSIENADIVKIAETTFIFLIMFLSGYTTTALIVTFGALLAYRNQFYWLTNKRLVIKSGILNAGVRFIPLEKIKRLSIASRFAERLFGFSSLEINLAVWTREKERLQAVPNPKGLQQKILKLKEKKATKK